MTLRYCSDVQMRKCKHEDPSVCVVQVVVCARMCVCVCVRAVLYFKNWMTAIIQLIAVHVVILKIMAMQKGIISIKVVSV